jgi:hypothetical protein
MNKNVALGALVVTALVLLSVLLVQGTWNYGIQNLINTCGGNVGTIDFGTALWLAPLPSALGSRFITINKQG